MPSASPAPAATAARRRLASFRRCSRDGLFGSGRVGIATSSPARAGSVACGPQHQARKQLALLRNDDSGGLGPFRGLEAPRALAPTVADFSLHPSESQTTGCVDAKIGRASWRARV